MEKYLDRCLESVTQQSYRDIEIILVDDGSTDNSSAMCDLWAERDGRIKVVHKQNEGLGMARNTGIDNAGGKYICFFDSDDSVESSLVEKCLAAAEKNGADAVVFGYCNVDDSGDVTRFEIEAEKKLFEGNAVKDELLPMLLMSRRGLGISACMKMFRRECLCEHGIRFRSEREIFSEDTLFVMEIFSRADKAVILPENLYYYYLRTSSISHKYYPGRHLKNDVFLRESLAFAEQNGLCNEAVIGIKKLYHSFVMAILKQTVTCDLSRSECRAVVNEILRSPQLRATLSRDVLSCEKKTMRMFFTLVRLRFYGLCRIMLTFRIKRKV